MRKLNPEYVEVVKSEVNGCPFFSLLSMSLVELRIGSCLLEIHVDNKHMQPFGIVHGGAFASIIDAATFWAVYPEVDEENGMTTVDLKLNYLAPSSHGKLIARGKRIKLGRTLGLGEAEVTDEDGKILAHGVSTVMVMPDLPFLAGGNLPPKFIKED